MLTRKVTSVMIKRASEKRMTSMWSMGILIRTGMVILDKNKSTNTIVDARQAIHPCISNAPMFYYLHYFFQSSIIYMCYMLVASPMV